MTTQWQFGGGKQSPAITAPTLEALLVWCIMLLYSSMSVITHYCFGNFSAGDQKRFQQIVKVATKITGLTYSIREQILRLRYFIVYPSSVVLACPLQAGVQTTTKARPNRLNNAIKLLNAHDDPSDNQFHMYCSYPWLMMMVLTMAKYFCLIFSCSLSCFLYLSLCGLCFNLATRQISLQQSQS